jgi:hypothetical protein
MMRNNERKNVMIFAKEIAECLFLYKCETCGEIIAPDEKGRIYINKKGFVHELQHMEMPPIENMDLHFHCCKPEYRKYGRLVPVGFVDLAPKDTLIQDAYDIINNTKG